MNKQLLPSTSLFRNVMASGLARVARAFLQIFITPLIIRLLGPEQYGLIAFSMTLQMIFFIFDQAMSPAVIREFGIMDARPEHRRKMWNLFHTFERVSFFMAGIIGAGVFMFAPYIAQHWLHATSMDLDKMTLSVRMMAALIAFQWPTLLYGSCFIGLQRQASIAGLTILILAVQTATALAVLYFFSSSVVIYILIQVLFVLLLSVLMRQSLIRIMPAPDAPPEFDKALLKSLRKFAGGTFLIGATAVVLSQADKILVAKWVSLDDFAAYALAFNLTGQLSTILLSPLLISIQPLMARLIHAEEPQIVAREYHRFCQLNALVNFTCFGALAFFAQPLLMLWLGKTSPLLSTMTHLLPLVVIGAILNALSAMPYTIQMTAGWIRLRFIINLCLAGLFVLGFYLLFPLYGMTIGPVLWIGINLIYLVFEAPIMHSKYLKGEYLPWISKDILLPGISAFAIFLLCHTYLPVFDNLWLELLKTAFSASIVGMVLLGLLPLARETVISTGKRLLKLAV